MVITCGTVKKIVYHSDDFYILSVTPFWGDVKVNEEYNNFTAKGNTPESISEGDIWTLYLEETISKKYGRGYAFQQINHEYPSQAEDQLALLNGILRFYGTPTDWNTAKATVFTGKEPYKQFTELQFSSTVANILSHFTPPDEYRKMLEPYKLPAKNVNDFSNACKLVFAPSNVLGKDLAKTLHQTNISANTLIMICKALRHNKLELPKRDDPFLFDLSVRDKIKELMANGDTCVSRFDVRQRVMQFRGMENPATFETLMSQRPSESHIIEVGASLLMLDTEYECESAIKAFVESDVTQPNYYEKDFKEYVEQHECNFTDEQLHFAELVFTHPIAALTGGAGTGKSYTLGHIVEFLRSVNANVVCTAPTAQAAKVLKSYTHGPTSTIHSFLLSEDECDFLVVDESSMIDSHLCAQIIDYVDETNCTLILSGDISQLPPVGVGAPYRDILIETKSKVTLTKIFRQKNLSLINVLDTARKGEFNIVPTNEWQSYGESVMYKNYSEVSDTLDLILHDINKYGLKNVGIISPLNRVVTQLNTELQASLNKQDRVVKTKNEHFGEGDPVILKKNKEYATRDNLRYANKSKSYLNTNDVNYVLNNTIPLSTVKAYNGDHGHVIEILNMHQFIIELDDSMDKTGMPYQILFDTADSREELEASQVTLGYASTVHKAQGSQFEIVFFISPSTMPQMTSCPMIYTALSRAKNSIRIFAQTKFSNMPIDRNTLLKTSK